MMQFVPATIALIGCALAPVVYWCVFTTHVCYGTFISNIEPGVINPFYSFSLYTLPITIILIFVPREIFKSWLKFAAWALPFAFIYIATTPVSGGGIGLNFSNFYRDDAARLMGGVFSIISAVLVVLKFIAARRKK